MYFHVDSFLGPDSPVVRAPRCGRGNVGSIPAWGMNGFEITRPRVCRGDGEAAYAVVTMAIATHTLVTTTTVAGGMGHGTAFARGTYTHLVTRVVAISVYDFFTS